MILENATVVAVESDALWVEAVQKSACGTCIAQKGCGTRVLSKLTGKTSRVRVLASADHLQTLCPGQSVTIGIPEDVVVGASLLVYLLPLMGSLMGLWLMAPISDIASVLGATVGLFTGGALVSLHSRKTMNNPHLNPVLYEYCTDQQIVNIS